MDDKNISTQKSRKRDDGDGRLRIEIWNCDGDYVWTRSTILIPQPTKTSNLKSLSPDFQFQFHWCCYISLNRNWNKNENKNNKAINLLFFSGLRIFRHVFGLLVYFFLHFDSPLKLRHHQPTHPPPTQNNTNNVEPITTNEQHKFWNKEKLNI